MSEHLSILSAIDRLVDGTIRIPGFQRKFVWEPKASALLMDSIYKQFPIGSILLWRTTERLKVENRLGTFELPPPDKDYPVDYVLDGQQRLTSIFTTFQRRIDSAVHDPEVWLPIYYDFDAVEDAQDSRFAALPPEQASPQRYFPLSTFFEPVEFSLKTRELDESRHREIVTVQQRFLSLLLPVQTFETEDRATVAIVFERVNRMGTPLDTYQLLTAWTWSDDFNLQERFAQLSEEFEDFGFEDVGDDSDLMMRCTAAVLTGDPSPTALVSVNGGVVRQDFGVVERAIRRSIDFVRQNFHVRHLKLLPYPSLLVPLSAFFSVRQSDPLTDGERQELVKWFWRSCFSHRYSGNPQRNIKRDIEEAINLRKGEESSLADITSSLKASFFLRNNFSIRNVATKTFVLLLASRVPKSFISGEPVSLDDVLSEPNRREYHHCYPRAFLAKLNPQDNSWNGRVNALANFAIISRAENRDISDKAPSVYRSKMPADVTGVMDSALLPPSLFGDDFTKFAVERAEMLAAYGRKLADLKAEPERGLGRGLGRLLPGAYQQQPIDPMFENIFPTGTLFDSQGPE
ncbi:GmrSD restriction endonuclease domain-containing protein [Micromonospora sp. DT233]|uniref:GmrSD restriction endonuclease domain-containing protein n=1 Tax=Micromonospora sp. DT233 TaxID=3393432 RepID=UPI003CEC88EB